MSVFIRRKISLILIIIICSLIMFSNIVIAAGGPDYCRKWNHEVAVTNSYEVQNGCTVNVYHTCFCVSDQVTWTELFATFEQHDMYLFDIQHPTPNYIVYIYKCARCGQTHAYNEHIG